MTDHLGGPTSPVLGKTLEAGQSVRLPYFGDDPWFCNTFGLRAEIYVTKGAPGFIGKSSLLFLVTHVSNGEVVFCYSSQDFRHGMTSLRGFFLDTPASSRMGARSLCLVFGAMGAVCADRARGES